MPIRGRFYLRLTSNGNLTGEFCHNQDNRIYTESADRTAGDPFDEFPGTYLSTWHEFGNGSVLAQLVITRFQESRLFTLEWREMNDGLSAGRPSHEGRAMIGEGLLIGDYWSV